MNMLPPSSGKTQSTFVRARENGRRYAEKLKWLERVQKKRKGEVDKKG
jgi:hypothetical protein